jgi:effector-binding domain-containing protein
MIETSVVVSQPMLYITTRSSERPSAIASTIKLSLDQVRRFMDATGIAAAGDPLGIFSDWNGRLVTLEVGYPVSQQSLSLASGRIQAGWTPGGSAVLRIFKGTTADYDRHHEALLEEIRAAGLRTTGTTWEIYRTEHTDAEALTEFHVQLLPREPGHDLT